MSDESIPVIEVTTHFKRQIQPAQYETASAEVTIAARYPGTMSPEEIATVAAGNFQLAKVQVYEELGLNYKQDETTNIIMEVFPDSKVVGHLPRKLAAAQPERAIMKPEYEEVYGDEPDPPPYDGPDYVEEESKLGRPVRPQRPSQLSRSQRPANRPAGRQRAPQTESANGMTTDDFWEDLEKHPDRWFDNRDSKTNPKAPDFRSKRYKNDQGYNQGLWLVNMPDWVQLPDAEDFG